MDSTAPLPAPPGLSARETAGNMWTDGTFRIFPRLYSVYSSLVMIATG
jgi:hypothetical protein